MSIENYSVLHETMPGYGRTGLRLKPFVVPLIQDSGAIRILDFGCGKGALGNSLLGDGLDVTLFDPFVEVYSQKPEGKFDIVLNTDVLEHIPEDVLPSVLKEIRGYSEKAVFVISLTFADHILANGDNAHCTIRSKAWWEEKLRLVFPYLEEVPTRQDTACCFVTWKSAPETTNVLGKLRSWVKRKEGIKRRVMAPARRVADGVIPWVSEVDLFARLEGRSVALVGNSPELANAAHGADIDAHDIVVRLNRAPIISTKSHGSKTDWIATSTPISSGLVDGRGVSMTLWLTAKSSKIPLWMFRGKRPVFRLARSESAALQGELLSRPSSGFMAFMLLKRSRASRLSLYGFDGFNSGSLSGEQTKEAAPHNFDLEIKTMKAAIAEDSRLLIGPVGTGVK